MCTAATIVIREEKKTLVEEDWTIMDSKQIQMTIYAYFSLAEACKAAATALEDYFSQGENPNTYVVADQFQVEIRNVKYGDPHIHVVVTNYTKPVQLP